MSGSDAPSLYPAQVCFVVDDVARAVEQCQTRFGWGPFQQFSAPIAEARYRDWRGAKRTDVALGMAGSVQIELIHVHEGHDTVEAYQAKYGAGFQHLGIYCRDRDRGVSALEKLGAVLDDRGEHEGIRFAFLDVPTGPGMFELLHATGAAPGGEGGERDSAAPSTPPIEIDRATIVAPDFDASHAFFSAAFGWTDVPARTATLRHDGGETRLRRARGIAGKLLLELVEPQPDGRDPYSEHARQRDHGLVHAGGALREGWPLEDPGRECAWLEDAEEFALYDWAGGPAALQLRA